MTPAARLPSEGPYQPDAGTAAARQRVEGIGTPGQGPKGRSDRLRGCATCGQVHIPWTRPDGLGCCHGYRTPQEHYHPTYDELLECSLLGDEPHLREARATRAKRAAR